MSICRYEPEQAHVEKPDEPVRYSPNTLLRVAEKIEEMIVEHLVTAAKVSAGGSQFGATGATEVDKHQQRAAQLQQIARGYRADAMMQDLEIRRLTAPNYRYRPLIDAIRAARSKQGGAASAMQDPILARPF